MKNKETIIAGSIIAGAVIALVGGWSAFVQLHIEHETVTIEGKERLMQVSSDSEGKTSTRYTNMVYAGGEAYEVSDSIWNWHFRSRTVYAQLNDGETCDVTLSGYRWGFLNMHQNIITAECE